VKHPKLLPPKFIKNLPETLATHNNPCYIKSSAGDTATNQGNKDMNFSNNAVIATLKVINERMDYLSNEVEDRTYDQLMELNELGDMREYLKGLAA